MHIVLELTCGKDEHTGEEISRDKQNFDLNR